jgi:hypothetical protein
MPHVTLQGDHSSHSVQPSEKTYWTIIKEKHFKKSQIC